MKNKYIEELEVIHYKLEKYILKHFKYIHDDVYDKTSFLPDNVSWSIRMYFYMEDLHDLKLCVTCGKPHANRFDYCSIICARKSPIKSKRASDTYHKKSDIEKKSIRIKIEDSIMNIYGVKNVFQSDVIKEKCKLTKQERYGDENYVNVEKRKETNLERYGVEHNSQLQHHKEIVSEKLHTKESNENRKQAFMDKYGVENFMLTDKFSTYKNTEHMLKKQIETKRKNNSFNKSKLEDEVFHMLCDTFNIVRRQYTSKLYPFMCDFYVEDYDLYIECNFHWTHGGEPYNKNKEDHQRILKGWSEKSNHSNFYKNAIKTWTERDVQKFDIVMAKNLNFCSLYNKEDIKNLLGEYDGKTN